MLFAACTRARDSLYVSWTGQTCPLLVGPRAGRSRHSLLVVPEPGTHQRTEAV